MIAGRHLVFDFASFCILLCMFWTILDFCFADSLSRGGLKVTKKNDDLMLQIKKERLDKHLAEVERLIGEWIPQLCAPDPFASDTHGGSWGWQSRYEPDTEKDSDSNHILRKHLKSRALWKHHADWQGELGLVFQMLDSAQKKAAQMHQEARNDHKPASKKREYTESYLGTALWRAFCLARKQTPNIDYTRGDGGKGVKFGGYVIETSSGTEAEFAAIGEEHRELSRKLSKLNEMKEIAEEWALICELQSRMQMLISKALKSSDYLYPCTFCKRLWKA